MIRSKISTTQRMCCFLVAVFICMVAATSANAAKIYAEMQLFGDKISLQTGSETGNIIPFTS